MANKEIGRIGQRRYGGTIYEEFLHELRGTRGIEVYREMSENDDVVGAILFAIEMLVRQCDWNVEPGGDTAKDKEAAEFVESCMHDMQDTWTDTISEILSFLTYGSAGYIFTWDMLENGILLPILNYPGAPGTHSELVEGLMAYDMKKTADDLAFFGCDAV